MSPGGESDGAALLDLEDTARVECYALLARLYYAAPDRSLLNAIGGVVSGGGADHVGDPAPVAAAWQALAAASRAMDAEAAVEEYDDVFVGTGRAEVTPYASHYLGAGAPERALVTLRKELAALGLARKSAALEPEDHLAALCDVMRYLVLRGNGDAALQQQKHFFEAYISPWYAAFCVSVAASGKTNFYKHVAMFTEAFLDVEAESFKLT